MGERMRAKDWSTTPLGPPETWPQSLRTVIRIVLTSRYAMWMLWGPDFTFFCNDAYLPTVGVKQDWVLGARSDKVWEEIWPDIGPRIATVLRTNTATYDENLLLFLERSGYVEETYHTFSYSPLADDDGAVVGMLCVVTEVTDKIIGERRLAMLSTLATRLAGITSEAEIFPALVAACDGHPDLPFIVPFLNDDAGQPTLQAAAKDGDPKFLAQAKVFFRGLPRRDGEAFELPEAMMTALPAGPWLKKPNRVAVVPFTEGGTTIPAGHLVIGLNPFRHFSPTYQRFLDLLAGQVGANLTGARVHEAERKRAAALAELDHAKTVFFSNISHEFRTPLTLMLGPLGDMLGEPGESLTPPHRNRLEVAHRNAQRLLKLVNTLLDFSRIEAGRMQARYEPVDLSRLTAELAANFESAVNQAGLSLAVDCKVLDEPVFVDRDMWEKIVLNLMSNAFKFTFEGVIAVSLSKDGSFAALTVRDSGVGIPEADLPRLFERFHRVEGQRSRTHEGSGIGLALVHELVDLHGGSISVDSTVGKGTTFTIRLPLGRAHLPTDRIVPQTDDKAISVRGDAYAYEALRWLPEGITEDMGNFGETGPVDLPTGRSTARILLADDNADMRSYVLRLLRDRWDVEIAEDGRAALEAIRRRKPDLVLSDVMMPRLDGIGLLREVRSDPALRDLPVILLSARAGEEARLEGFDVGADDYLVKPFSARELIGRISSNLDMARIRQDATEALRQRTEQFETLLNAAPLGVYLVDADFCVRQVNPTAQAVFRNIPDVVGRDFDEVIRILWPKRYADQVIRVFRHTLETGEPYHTPEAIEQRLDQPATEYYEWQIHRIRLPDGRYGVVCYFRDISAQVMARLRQKLLLDELNHRVKNTLATVQSIAVHTLRAAKSTGDARTSLEARLLALSKAHDVLTREQWAKANLHEIINAAVAPYAAMDGRFKIAGPAAFVQPRAALALSMALHELFTNAAKYGALSNDLGRIAISWQIDEKLFKLQWEETGGPAVVVPRARGFGSRLIERGLAQDLAGTVKLDFAPVGLTCSITATLEELTANEHQAINTEGVRRSG